ncbi:1959_t:CDS:1, partial [Dentiscutata erythropus]
MQTEVSPDTPSPLSSGGASINEQSSGESIVILNESPETDIQPSNGIEIVNNENTIDS